jgi:ABC-type glycerol-3-phosphate transport system substrate-binding protein
MVADAAHDFPADLTDWVPQEIIDNFGDTMEECYLDGKMLCLRNDVAQIVMFYNAPLMTELGYEVPETWEEFIALSLQVKQDHPDKEYYLGTCGEGMYWNAYFMASECPALQEISTSEVRINPTYPNCTRTAEMIRS